MIFTACLWMWSGAILVLDWYGGGQSDDALSMLLNSLLFDTPWYAPLAAASLLTLGLLYIWLRKKKRCR